MLKNFIDSLITGNPIIDALIISTPFVIVLIVTEIIRFRKRK